MSIISVCNSISFEKERKSFCVLVLTFDSGSVELLQWKEVIYIVQVIVSGLA